MKKKSYIFLFLGFLILVLAMAYLPPLISGKTPQFIQDKLNQLSSDRALMDSIGGQSSFKYMYNKNELKFKDTIKYTVEIQGHQRKLTYFGLELRRGKEDWVPLEGKLIIE
jgi:hypothetical protein